MKLSFDFDMDDWLSFQRYALGHLPSYRRLRFFQRFSCPAAFIIFIVVHNFQRGQFDLLFAGLFGSAAVLWMLFYPAFYNWRIINRSRKQLLKDRKKSGDSDVEHREIEMLPDSLRSATPLAESTIKAAAITKVEVTRDALLLYTGSSSTIVVPRRKLDPALFDEAACFCPGALCPGDNKGAG